MSESSNWNQAWLETQKQYWDAWFDMSRKASENLTSTTSAKPGEGLDFWWETARAGLPAEVRDMYGKIFEMGKNFLGMGETFAQIMQSTQNAGDDWQKQLRENMEAFKARMGGTNEGRDGWQQFAGVWGLPADAWQNFVNALPGDPSALMGGAMGDAGHNPFRHMFALPAMGYNREWQEKAQEWALMAADYSEAMKEYSRLLNRANQKSVDILTQRLTDMAQCGEAPENMRALYDLWVDCGEEAYAELAMDDEYLVAQGKMTNALMDLKKHEQDMLQDVLQMMNLPSRRELDSITRRLHELRREMRQFEDDVAETGVEGLQQEVAKLREEVAALKSAQAAGGDDAKPAARKTTVKKKAAAKKSASSK